MDTVGLGSAYREANDASLYTVEAHIRYLEEVSAGSDLEVRSSIIGATAKLLWIWHQLWVLGPTARHRRGTRSARGRAELGAVPRRPRGPGAGRVHRASRGGRRPDPTAPSDRRPGVQVGVHACAVAGKANLVARTNRIAHHRVTGLYRTRGGDR